MLRNSFSRFRGRTSAALDTFACTCSTRFQPIIENRTFVAPCSNNNNEGITRLYAPMPTTRIRTVHVDCRLMMALPSYARPPSQVSMLAQRYIQQRFFSSTKKKESNNDTKPDTKSTIETAASSDEPGRLSSIIGSVGPTLRKVTEWNLPDLVSVYAVVLLVSLILFSPYVIEKMKQAQSQYVELDEYDPIAQVEKIVRYELFGEEALEQQLEHEQETTSTNKSRRSIDNTIDMAADVLQSEALQEAIASLITRVLESVQFQNACQTLLKNLWNDLVNDPETMAQVVQLLNNAIQNKEIQRSVRQLVLQLIQDKQVYDELTRLLVRLGQEDQVLDATRALLTTSAHNALNDPEILDHSMEFATDVVGDDVVQQTSGEALRNTVTYAAGPGVSAFLSILGIGLVWFAISAFGKSRASEQEAAMVDKAMASVVRSIESSARGSVSAVASLPSRLLSMIATIITFPFRIAEKGLAGLGRTGENIVRGISNAFHSIVAIPGVIARAAMAQLGRFGRSLSEKTSGIVSRIGAAISASFVGPILDSVATAGRAVLRELSRAAKPLRHVISASVSVISGSLSKLSGMTASFVSSTRTCVNAVLAFSSRIVRNGAVRLNGVCSQCGSVIKSSVMLLAAKSEHARMVTIDLAKRLGSQCGSLVKSAVFSLAAKSQHAQKVTGKLFRRLFAQCDTLFKSLAIKSAHAESVALNVAKQVGATLKAAGARITSSLTAVATWCLKIFQRDGRSDSPTTT